MASGAHIRIDQAANPVPVGTYDATRLDVYEGQPVTLTGDSNGGANTSPSFTLTSGPPGASLTLSAPNTFAASWTPVAGEYIAQLAVNDGIGANTTTIKIVVSADLNGIGYDFGQYGPAYGEVTGQDNAGGNVQGYAAAFLKMRQALGPRIKYATTLRSNRANVHDHVQVQYRAYEGDQGGGIFDWRATSTAADDGGTVFQPGFGTGHPLATGRWHRRGISPGYVRAVWFDVRPASAAFPAGTWDHGAVGNAAIKALPVFSIGSPLTIVDPNTGHSPSRMKNTPADLTAHVGTVEWPNNAVLYCDTTILMNPGINFVGEGDMPYRWAGTRFAHSDAMIAASVAATNNVYITPRPLGTVPYRFLFVMCQLNGSATNDSYYQQLQRLAIHGGGNATTAPGYGLGGLWIEAGAQGCNFTFLDIQNVECPIVWDGVAGGGAASIEEISITGPLDAPYRAPGISIKNPVGIYINKLSIVGRNSLVLGIDDVITGAGAGEVAASVFAYEGNNCSITIKQLVTEHCAHPVAIGHDDASSSAISSVIIEGHIGWGSQCGGWQVTGCTGNGVPLVLTVPTGHPFVPLQRVTVNPDPAATVVYPGGAPNGTGTINTKMLGNTALNGVVGIVTAKTATTITIGGLNGNGTWTSGGIVEQAPFPCAAVSIQGNVGYARVNLAGGDSEGGQLAGSTLGAYSNTGRSFALIDVSSQHNPVAGGAKRSRFIQYRGPQTANVINYESACGSMVVHRHHQSISLRNGAAYDKLDWGATYDTDENPGHTLLSTAATNYEIDNHPVKLGTQFMLAGLVYEYVAVSADGTVCDVGHLYIGLKGASIDCVKQNGAGATLVTFSVAVVDAAGAGTTLAASDCRVSVLAQSSHLNTGIKMRLSRFARFL